MNLVLDGVGLRSAGAKALAPWTLELGPGTHGLSLASDEAALELGRVVAGLERPKRGRVLLGGEDPHASPALRARIGSTSGLDFSGLTRLSAQEFWKQAGEARARHGAVAGQPIGLLAAGRFEAPLGRLSPQELRDFELELALGVDNPHLVWLSQAPRLATQTALELVLARLRQRAADGAVVVVMVCTAREAELWGDEHHRAPQVRADAPGFTIQLTVERPREIAAELQGDAAVLGTTLDSSRPGLLLVRGTDELALRRACAKAVVARRCELREMVSLPGGGA